MDRRHFVFSLAALAPGLLVAAEQSSTTATSDIPKLNYMVQLRYWAKPGRADDVYNLRVKSTEVLQRLGAVKGSLLRGAGGDDPDVVWKGEFPDRESARKPHFAAQKSEEFQAIAKQMGELCRRIEGSFYQEVIPTRQEN